jgi:Tfp pilus assembly protein PilO
MQLTPKRIDLMATALLVAALSLGYTLGLKRELGRWGELKRQEGLLQSPGGRGLEDDLARLSAEIGAIDRDVALIRRELPPRHNLPAFLAEFDDLCRANGVRLAVVKPEEPQPGELFLKTPLTLSGEASFPDFYRLLYQTEQTGQALAIDRLKLERPEGLERCRFEMAVSLLSAGG